MKGLIPINTESIEEDTVNKKARHWKTGTNTNINCTLNRLRISLLVKGCATIIRQRQNVKHSTLQRFVKIQSQKSVVSSKKKGV